ncbi:MAG TPA: T9SS type A sorting domain-containing protein, partial [Candidatus Marinimicrobia bacterium]|nr:T9SS type A sorting domain-containing protein [Candidatus Neomarinimicrobiota bacterium]
SCADCMGVPNGDAMEDCAGECGGDAVVDECGECGGSGPEEGFNCDGMPLEFVYNQSTEQAFYLFEIVTINGVDVEGDDWVGAFNGEVCVGARKWDTSLCGDSVCDVPVMGNDGSGVTEGYMNTGDFPTFKIYDASENLFYPAQPSEEYPFSNGEFFFVESLSVGIDYTLTLDNHHNLVSFYSLPEDVSIAGIMSGLGNNAISVMAEGESAVNSDGVWIGSLTEFSAEKGFWISIDNYPDSLSVIGIDMNPDRIYELHEGPNLISFPDSGSVDLSSAIPDDVEDLFIAIIAEGISAINLGNDVWAGSLTGFQGGAGYWVIVQEDLSFSYNTEDLLVRSAHSFSEKLPDGEGFTVAQSSKQAFYYVDDIKLDQGGVEVGDWILSYNNDILSGIRQWNGNSIDIPTMGSSGDLVTAGYFNEGDVPTFKLLKQSSGELIALEGNVPNWSDNGIYSIGELYEKQPIPELFVLNKAYPNPFNPVTTIDFGLPMESHVEISIFDLRGQKVETLVNKFSQPGSYSINWNASHSASGVYFIHFTAWGDNTQYVSQIQKLMLVK